jgi:hypothetical protein
MPCLGKDDDNADMHLCLEERPMKKPKFSSICNGRHEYRYVINDFYLLLV